MAWVYHEVTDDDVNKVIGNVDRYLNQLNTSLKVKFDVSNAQHSLARGVVFYEEAQSANKTSAAQAAAAAPAGAPTIAWNQYTWHSPDQYKLMYQGFADALNGGQMPNGETLSSWQVENARCVFTNAHESDATLSIYY